MFLILATTLRWGLLGIRDCFSHYGNIVLVVLFEPDLVCQPKFVECGVQGSSHVEKLITRELHLRRSGRRSAGLPPVWFTRELW